MVLVPFFALVPLFAFISVPDTFVCLVSVAHSTVVSVLVPVSAVGSVNDPTGDV